jgi:cation:H+ antiporter
VIFAGALLLFLLGIALLWGGAEWLVRGAAALGRLLGISPLVIGLTIVAFATSMPEMLVSLWATVVHDAGGLALGNVVGSNIANVGLVIGLCALVSPMVLRPGQEARELPVMIGVSILFVALAAWAGLIGRLDGAILLFLLIVITVWTVRSVRREDGDNGVDELPEMGRGRAVLMVVVGLAVLLVGADLITRSGTKMAVLLGVPDTIIGLTMVALGTSLPELAASLVSVIRGHPEIAFGNVVGSNLFNITFVAGTVSMVSPLRVERQMVHVDMPIMLAFSIALYLLMMGHATIGRVKGAFLLAGYLAYIAWVAFSV